MRVETAGGDVIELGTTGTGPTIGITDYSRRVTDDFGTTTVVERGFARRMSVRLALPLGSADALHARLTSLRASSALWLADDRFASLSMQGFYKDFSLDLNVGATCFCTLTVEGLAQPAGAPDSGIDPAPEGRVSSLVLLQPAAIGDAQLVTTTVPEDDYPAWTAGFYAKGARVIRGHRIWESLIAGNTSDPLAATGGWLDAASTNRWAMFDQALGTATAAQGQIAVTLAAGAVDGVALLDVVASTVRVQTAGYDQTRPVVGGAVTFLDLPSSSANVTITAAGSGAVSIGTLLVGRLVGLGVTEASPTAGITDYSRKSVDEFGQATIVERAWAKRMTAAALIRTDAIDVVADRIAAVRARPSLWIGDESLDSLTIYGFFKDFSIEVGETVSKLSLSVEGLSKAVALLPDIEDEVDQLKARLDFVELGSGAKVFNQADEPTGAKLNDLWFTPTGLVYIYLGSGELEQLAVETDQIVTINGEAIIIGGGWVLSTLSEAVFSAGGNLYFLDDDQPEATKIGDSWFNPTTGVLSRWSGSAWVPTADRTALNQHTFPQVPSFAVALDYQGTPVAGLPAVRSLRRYLGQADISPTASYSITSAGAAVATVNDTPGSEQRGDLTLTAAQTDTTITVKSTQGGVDLYMDVSVIVTHGAPPITGGGGGGGGGEPATPGTSSSSSGPFAPPSTSPAYVELTTLAPIAIGATGKVGLSVSLSFEQEFSSGQFDEDGSEIIPETGLALKWQREVSGGGWTDVTALASGWPNASKYLRIRTPKGVRNFRGAVNHPYEDTGLPAGASVAYRLLGVAIAYDGDNLGVTGITGTIAAAPQ